MTVIQCEICGRPIKQQVLCPDGDKWHILCPSCASQLNSCAFCKKSNICLFETDPSQIPKVIQQEIKINGRVFIQESKNPDRIREFCQKCSCFSEEFECMKQFNSCNKIEHIYLE